VYGLILQESFLNGSLFSRTLAHLHPERWLIFSGTVAQNTPYYSISAKIWRHTGEKWSRQSEEMPLHRVLDLAILICKARIFFPERYHKNEKNYPKYPLLDRVGLQGGAMNVSICKDNEYIESDINLFDDCLHKDDEIISERLNVLSGLLKEIKTT